jgi:RNA polymerase sigma-70 factor (ECF subfamily)
MKEGIRTEFLATYDAYADVVFRMCYAKTSSREEAKDLAQDTFIRVWERIEKNPEKIENMRAFVFTVARNLIKDYYKKKKPVLERDLPEGILEQVAVGPTAEVESERRIALDALTQIPDAYREVLMLNLVEGLPVNEIAELLGERPNTVSVRLKRGLEKVRNVLHA